MIKAGKNSVVGGRMRTHSNKRGMRRLLLSFDLETLRLSRWL